MFDCVHIVGDKDQAAIIFKKTKAAVERNPLLYQVMKPYRDSIEVPERSSFYQVLSADAPTAHGLNPTCVLADELWNQPNRDLWDALTMFCEYYRRWRGKLDYCMHQEHRAGELISTQLFVEVWGDSNV